MRWLSVIQQTPPMKTVFGIWGLSALITLATPLPAGEPSDSNGRTSDRAAAEIYLPGTDPMAEAVARELFQIQQQLGGSIVTDSKVLGPAAPVAGEATSSIYHEPVGLDAGVVKTLGESPVAETRPEAVRQIDALRDGASLLDASANRLERINLYSQADAMRQLAGQLRLDARALHAHSGRK